MVVIGFFDSADYSNYYNHLYLNRVKYLHKLSKKNYQLGAELCLLNAQDHLEVARVCSGKSFNGIAVSHLITGCEELCKASILRIKSLCPEVRIDDLSQYFYSHKFKHDKIGDLWTALYSFYECEENTEANNGSKNNTSVVILALVTLLLIAAFLWAETNKNQQESNNHQPITFEELRQQGLYVSLNDDKTWKSPNDIITTEQFDEIVPIIQEIYQTVEMNLFKSSIDPIGVRTILDALGYKEV